LQLAFPKKYRTLSEIIFIVLVCFISRLPQLLSENLILDGDEAIVALMSKHLYEGKDLSLFFWGQTYGFSLIEMLFISIGYLIGGINDISVKCSMLALWCVGVVFFFLFVRPWYAKDSFIPLLVTLAFILLPAWAVWSMKARGGYLTAFTASFVLLHLLYQKKFLRSVIYQLVVGILLILIFESQALWIPGLLPYLFYRFISLRNFRSFSWSLAGLLAGYLVFAFAKWGLTVFWFPDAITLSAPVLKNLREIPADIFLSMTGSYYLWDSIQPSSYTAYAAMIWALVIPALFVACCFAAAKRLTIAGIMSLGLLSVIFTLSYVPFLNGFQGRYLLPLSCFMVLSLALVLTQVKKIQLVTGLFIPVLFLGGFSLYSFRDFRFDSQSRSQLMSLCKKLEKKKYHYVFCTQPMLQWQIAFYSQEKSVARYFTYTDRYPPYVYGVNENYLRGMVTPIVGYLDNGSGVSNGREIIEGIYVVYDKPAPAFIRSSGFHFADQDL
jgi:hypothetical protein